MRYLSVCTGILGCKLALEQHGFEPAAYSEIDDYCSLIISERGGRPNVGDMQGINDNVLKLIGHVDALVGGTPCQSFSVAGLRNGMADPRGNLALEFLRLADATRAKWVVWENVPGVLSSDGGRDFGAFVGGLAELGYGWAYRVLDAQYWGLAQRRKRVFVVGCLGGWARAAAVLFERSCLRGDPPPSRETGARVAGAFTAGAHPGSYNGQDARELIAVPDPAYPITAGHRTAKFGSGRDAQDTFVISDVADPVTVTEGKTYDHCGKNSRPRNLIVFDRTQVTSDKNYSSPKEGDPCHPIAATAKPPTIAAPDYGVRRLTPTEVERLQGYPDGWTKVIMPDGKPASDTRRYRALGNTWAVPVMAWIGKRIKTVEELTDGEVRA